jgi:hypothetical protein
VIPYLLLFIAILLFKQNKNVVAPPIASIHNNSWSPKLGQGKKEKQLTRVRRRKKTNYLLRHFVSFYQ